MRGQRPDYWKDFSCIASECQDNCCIGWEIDVDPDSLKRYQNMEGSIGERLRAGIDTNGQPHFRIQKDRRCVFLNQENLCDIQKELGEDALCDICREHPRFYHVCGGIEEAGLGIACEEAARLILNRKDSVHFSGIGPECQDDWVCFLLTVREQLIQILQNRQIPIIKRMDRMLSYGRKVQESINQGHPIHKFSEEEISCQSAEQIFACDMEFWLSFYQELEIMDSRWHSMLRQAKALEWEDIPNEIFWEQLSVYFIFRHFTAAEEDDDIYGKIRFAVLSCLIIFYASKSLITKQLKDAWIRTAVLYSKEIEYSEENIEMIWEELLFTP